MTNLCPTCKRPFPEPKRSQSEVSRTQFELIKEMRAEGASWTEIGRALGLSTQAARSRAERGAAQHGVPWEALEMPEEARDDASDYVKLRELRVDAGLPWRMVGDMMGGKTAGWAQTRFEHLQKIYE